MKARLWLGVLAIICCLPAIGVADPLKLSLGADVEEKYNDNVFFTSDNTEEDFITRMKPWLRAGWKTEVVDMTLYGAADVYDYMDYDDLDAVDQTYRGKLANRWSQRFSTTLSAAYVADERRERELAETGLLFNNDNRQRQTYNLDGHYQLSELSAMSLTYSYQDEAFDDEMTYDVQSHFVQLVLTRDLSSVAERCTGRVALAGGIYEYNRDYDTMDPFFGFYPARVEDEQSIEYYALRLGGSYDWTERFKIDIDVGARFVRVDNTVTTTINPNPLSLVVPEATDEKDSWGYVATLEAVYSGEKWAFSALASHDLVPASGRDGTVERTTLRLGGKGRIVSDWHYHWSARGYLNRSDETSVAADEDELTIQLQGGLRYAFTPQWSLGADWQTFWLDDRGNEVEKTQNTALVRLQWNWPILE